jgi:ribosomal protein L17
MPVSLSNSKIRTYQRCAKKYSYRYVENLQPKRKDLPMERGVWLHELLEAHYKGKNWRQALLRLTKEFQGLFDEERQMFGDLPGEVERIFKAYLRYWDDSEWEIIDVERDFKIKVKGRVYKGRIDGIVRDKMGVWILEHKTTKTLPRDAPRIIDPQSTLYNLALRSMGLEGSGTIHNFLRTKPPSEPRVLVKGGLSVRCDTDYKTYLAAIRREELDPEDYVDVLRKLKKQEKFFRRFRVTWKKTALKSMFEDYSAIGDEIDSKTVFARSISKMCERDCPYFRICQIELEGGDAERVKRMEFKKEEGYG